MTTSHTATDRHQADLIEVATKRLGAASRTPHSVASALREAGHPVGDATVLAVYEAMKDTPVDPDAAFLRRRAAHQQWVMEVVDGRTLDGFADWEKGRG